MKKIKSLLICNSNMFIPTVLTEVLSNPNNHYLVISDTENITKFFNLIAIPNVDYIEYGQLQGRFDFIKKKRQLLCQVQQYDIGEIVFFHAEYGEMANWLMKRLAREIPIKYCKLYDSIPVPKCKKLLPYLKIKIRQWLFWGINMDILQGVYPFPSIPQKFFADIKAETISMPVDNDMVTKAVSDKLKDIKITGHYVLLTGTVVHDGYYSSEVYTENINKIIDTIGVENLVSKCHPRFSELYGLEEKLQQIPSFIPGNVLINSYNYYIGFESTLLVETAQAGKKAISLIDLLPTNDKLRKKTHELLDNRLQGRGTIYYPSNLEELKSLLV